MSSTAKTTTVPLLPELRLEAVDEIKAVEGINHGGGASVSGAVFNLSTSTIGAGIMSIPATMRVLGVIPALLLIAAVAFLSDASVMFLMKYTTAGSAGISYAGVMGESFGRTGAVVLQACVAVTNTGVLITFLIIIGDVISGNKSEGMMEHTGVLQEWFGEQWWNGRMVSLLIILVVILLPLVLLRRVDSLRFTSAISVLLAVVFVCISSALALYSFFWGTTETPRLLPDLSQQSFADLFTAVPVIVLAFTFHFNVHPIRAELRNNSDMKVAVRISLLLCATIYAAVGFFGYLLFGESTMSDILSNFDRNSGSHISPFLNDTVRLSYALHLVLVFPLLFYSLRLNIDQLLFSRSRVPLASDTIRFVSLTGILMAFVYVSAIAIPNIWTLFQFFGSTSAVCLSLIFPGAIVLRDIHGISKRRDKTLAATMVVLAVITSSIAIASNIMSSFGGKSNRAR